MPWNGGFVCWCRVDRASSIHRLAIHPMGLRRAGPLADEQSISYVPRSTLHPSVRLSVQALLDQTVDHRRVGQSRGVAHVFQLVAGDLAQDAPHDLARTGLRQTGRPPNQLGLGEAANFLADQGQQFLLQRIVDFHAVHRCDEGIDALAFEVMRVTDHGSFGDGVMQHQGAFPFGGADAVAGDVDHVIHPTGDPVVTVLVAARAVAAEVVTGVGLEVGVDHPLMVAVNAANLAWPAVLDRQYAAARAVDLLALFIQQHRLHAKERPGRRAGFEVGGAGQWSDQDGAGFGLPPGVDDWAAAFADHVVIPLPGFRVDRLPAAADQAQAGAVGAFDRAPAFTHQRTQGGGRGIEDVHLVFVDHLPEARGARVVGHAFEDQAGSAVGQRAVDDIAVPGDPADVGGAPVDVAFVVAEHVLVGHRRHQQID